MNNPNEFGSNSFLQIQVINCILKTPNCSSGGNGLSYAGSPYAFPQNVNIPTITPTYSGTLSSCVSNPPLPAGLVIDNLTCAISGTPSVIQPATSYVIKASNTYGSATAMISITIFPIPLLHLKFDNGSVLNSGSLVISLFNQEWAPVMTVGKDGDANGGYLYNTNNQYFTTAANADAGLPMGANPRTLCAWVNPSVLPALGTHMYVFRYGSTSIGSNGSALGISNQGGVQKIAFFGYLYDAYVDYTMPINTWSHLCATFNGGTTASLYVNGSFVADQALAGTGPLNTTPQSFVIGSWTGSGGLQYYWRGVLDDVRIYDIELSSTQIARIYSYGVTY